MQLMLYGITNNIIMNEDAIKKLLQKESDILISEKCNNPTYTLSKYQEYLESKYNIRISNEWTANFHADYRDLVYGRK